MQIDWDIWEKKSAKTSERWNECSRSGNLRCHDHASIVFLTSSIYMFINEIWCHFDHMNDLSPEFTLWDAILYFLIIVPDGNEYVKFGWLTLWFTQKPLFLWITCINIMIIVSTSFWSSFQELNDHACERIWSCFL